MNYYIFCANISIMIIFLDILSDFYFAQYSENNDFYTLLYCQWVDQATAVFIGIYQIISILLQTFSEYLGTH